MIADSANHVNPILKVGFAWYFLSCYSRSTTLLDSLVKALLELGSTPKKIAALF